MKRFLKGVAEWKRHMCMVFTAAVCIYMAISWLYGERSVGMGILLQLLAVCVLHGSLLKDLSLCAWAFDWFPADSLKSWGLFLLIFLVIFAVMTAGFEILFFVTGKKYGGLLGQYQKKHGQDEE